MIYACEVPSRFSQAGDKLHIKRYLALAAHWTLLHLRRGEVHVLGDSVVSVNVTFYQYAVVTTCGTDSERRRHSRPSLADLGFYTDDVALGWCRIYRNQNGIFIYPSKGASVPQVKD